MLDKQITSSIYTILEKPVTLPISLGWKTEKKCRNKYFLIINNLEDHINMKTVNTQAVASNQEIRGNVTSNRLRKTPATRTDDFFLW
jgi:hypothetical protein